MGSVTSTLDRYQRIAPFYDLLDFPFEYGRYRKIRPMLFTGLSGLILDAGVGTGRNFPFYPRKSKIVGIVRRFGATMELGRSMTPPAAGERSEVRGHRQQIGKSAALTVGRLLSLAQRCGDRGTERSSESGRVLPVSLPLHAREAGAPAGRAASAAAAPSRATGSSRLGGAAAAG